MRHIFAFKFPDLSYRQLAQLYNTKHYPKPYTVAHLPKCEPKTKSV